MQLVPDVLQVALDWIFVIVASAGIADNRSTDRKHFLIAHLGVVAAFLSLLWNGLRRKQTLSPTRGPAK